MTPLWLGVFFPDISLQQAAYVSSRLLNLFRNDYAEFIIILKNVKLTALQ